MVGAIVVATGVVTAVVTALACVVVTATLTGVVARFFVVLATAFFVTFDFDAAPVADVVPTSAAIQASPTSVTRTARTFECPAVLVVRFFMIPQGFGWVPVRHPATVYQMAVRNSTLSYGQSGRRPSIITDQQMIDPEAGVGDPRRSAAHGLRSWTGCGRRFPAIGSSRADTTGKPCSRR